MSKPFITYTVQIKELKNEKSYKIACLIYSPLLSHRRLNDGQIL